MATKFMREAKFRSAGSKLKVYAHEGKTGFNVGVSIKNPGMKALTGCQENFDNAEAAEARFKARVQESLDNGWVPREANEGGTRRVSFTSVPQAPAAPEPVKSQERVVEGDVVDKDGFVIDPKEGVGEVVPAEQPTEVTVKNGPKRRK